MKDTIIFPKKITPDQEISGEGREDYYQNYLRIQFVEHRQDLSGYNTKVNPFSLQINKTVYLPFELEYFRYMYEMPYTSHDLKMFKNIVYEGAQKSGGTISSILETMKQGVTAKDENDNFTIDNNALAYASSGVINTMLNSGDTNRTLNGVKFAEGIAYNANPRMMFDGTGMRFRTISINWDLLPKNEEEAKDVYDIETIFYKHVLPEKFKSESDLTKFVYAYKYPNKLLIQPFVGGKPYNKHRFFPLVVTALTIGHSGGGGNTPSFYDTKSGRRYPVKTSIHCTLQETKIVTREDVKYLHGVPEEENN